MLNLFQNVHAMQIHKHI